MMEKSLETIRTLAALRLVSAIMILSSGTAYSQLVYDSVTTCAGTSVPGLFDAPLASARFHSPYGVCADTSTGSIYVADGQNHCIRKISNGLVTTVAGNGIAGDIDGIGINARFNNPTGVYFRAGYLFICDNLNHKIKRMDSLGMVSTIAGNGGNGLVDGAALNAQFNEPKSLVANDSGVVFVADYENHCIRRISTGTVTTVAGTGIAGDGTGPGPFAQLHRPRDLCLDPIGNLYFVDLGNHKVKVLLTTGTVELLAGSGIPGANDGLGAAASFSTPVAIDWETPSLLMVMDAVGTRFRRVDLSGNVATVAGSGLVGYQNGPVSVASFDLPQDICMDGLGRIYVGDFNNHVIRVVVPHGIETSIPASFAPPTLPIHPTPTASLVTIDVSGVADPLSGLLVYDERGALVLRMEEGALRGFGQGAISIDVAHWPAGSYAVLVSTRSRVYRSTIVR